MGRAVYNPGSEISPDLHPRGRSVRRSLASEPHRESQNHRESLRIDAYIYRLLHAEADGIPGLVADCYGDYFVLQVGSAAVEVGSLP